MKRFLNRIARSITTVADAIARLTDDQFTESRRIKGATINDIREDPNHEDENSLLAAGTNRSQQDFIRTELATTAFLPQRLQDEGFTEQSQPIAQPDDGKGENEVSSEKYWLSFEDSSDSFQSDISLDTKHPTDPGLDEIGTDESPVQYSDWQNVANASLVSAIQLPIDNQAASPVGESPQHGYAGETSAESQYLGFDISLCDLEEKSESTWQEDPQPYVSLVQPIAERADLELECIEPGQASNEFDIAFADLAVRQQSTWHESRNETPAQKSTTPLTNIESDTSDDHKSKPISQANSSSQQGSTTSAGIQGAASLHEAPDDYWVFRRINLRPDGLEELQLRQSGALAWDFPCDPEDYIWALDGVGYFDNIWNVEGFFESMIGEAEDRYCEALYWFEYPGD